MNKIKLIENTILNIKKENIEKLSLKETVKGKEYEGNGILKNIPISKYIKNKNERIYPKELWENVKKQGIFEGSLALADHPEDNGSIKNITGIWKNLKVLKENVTGDLYLVGRYGNLILEIVEKEGKVGISTCGYGELNENKVIPESYEYERTDLVLDPSQNVFITKENLNEKDNESKNGLSENDITNKNKKEEEIEEKKESKNELSENETTNNIEKEKEVKKMDKFLEANLKNQVNSLVKEAKKKENIVEAIVELKEIEIPEGVSSMITEKISNAIDELQVKLDEKKQSAEKELTEKIKKFDELEKKYNELNEKFEKAEKVIETAGIEDKEEDKEENEDVKTLKENVSGMETDLEAFYTDSKLRDNDIKILVQERKDMASDISELKSKLEEAENHCEQADKELEKFDFKFEEEKKSKKKEQDENEDEDEDKKDKDKDKDDEDKDEKKEKKEKKESLEYKFNYKKLEEKSEKKEQDEDEDKEDEDKDKDKDKDKGKDDEDKDENKKKESTENKEIKRIYENQVKKYKGLEIIKDSILNSKDEIDAVRKIIKFKEEINKDDLLDSNARGLRGNSPSWLGNRK